MFTLTLLNSVCNHFQHPIKKNHISVKLNFKFFSFNRGKLKKLYQIIIRFYKLYVTKLQQEEAYVCILLPHGHRINKKH